MAQSFAARGEVGMASRSISMPTPAAMASSYNPVATPPSVGSCIAVTLPLLTAICVGSITLMPGSCRKEAALSTSIVDQPRSKSACFSRA